MKRLLALLIVLALVFGSTMPILANDTVDTEAVITGAGGDPSVLVKWEGPDMDPVKPGVQIVPNPAGPLPGQGGLTDVWVYAVVTDPNGIDDIADVFFKIYHPDGSFKLQIHMTRVKCQESLVLFREARAAGLLHKCPDSFDMDEVEWMLDCEKKQAELWRGKWVYEIHQPDGWYRTQVVAVDTDGGTGECNNTDTEIISIVQLATDFTKINWGEIKPSVRKWVAGDDHFVPGDGKPTVWNQGNNPASLKVHNTALTGVHWGKKIIEFDVKLLGQAIYYEASQWVTLVGPLMPCIPKQIEFSVKAPYGLPKDTYKGEIHLEMIHAVVQ